MIPINCEYSPYTLPTIDFVGGESQRLAFHTYFYKTGAPFSLSSCAADFSIASFTNRSETPVLSRLMEMILSTRLILWTALPGISFAPKRLRLSLPHTTLG